MPTIDIQIVRRDDPPPWPDVREAIPVDDLVHVAVLEGGMTSGAPSVAIRLDVASSRTAIVETSLAAWIAATCAMRGAFPEAFTDTPLEGSC